MRHLLNRVLPAEEFVELTPKPGKASLEASASSVAEVHQPPADPVRQEKLIGDDGRAGFPYTEVGHPIGDRPTPGGGGPDRDQVTGGTP